jgi:hypothetical protein
MNLMVISIILIICLSFLMEKLIIVDYATGERVGLPSWGTYPAPCIYLQDIRPPQFLKLRKARSCMKRVQRHHEAYQIPLVILNAVKNLVPEDHARGTGFFTAFRMTSL